jgi:hypothetical protein
MSRIGRPPSDEYLAAERERDIYGIPAYVFKAWNAQRYSAKKRGIPFRFGLFQWHCWWRSVLVGLGPEAKRGNRKGQYMMARTGDQGAYEAGNVYAATPKQNIADIPQTVRLRASEKATITAKANGKPRGYHLKLGNPHPMAHAVETELGAFPSIRLASQAHGFSERTGRTWLRRGAWTLA